MRKIFLLFVLGFMVCSVNAQVCLTSSSASPFAVESQPSFVNSANFIADGKADLTVANNMSNNVYYSMCLLHLLPLMR